MAETPKKTSNSTHSNWKPDLPYNDLPHPWADENHLVCVFVDYVLTLEISGRFVGDANRRHLRFRRACPNSKRSIPSATATVEPDES